MASVTHRASTASTSNTTSYVSDSFTPAANELLFAIVHASGTTAADATLSDSQSLGWTLIATALRASSADRTYLFVANALAAASSMTVTFDCSSDAATGAIIQVGGISGMTFTGAAAVRQYKVISNQSAGTPAISFDAICLTGDVTIGTIGNSTTPAGLTNPTNWSTKDDTGYSSPTRGGNYVTRDSGFTGTTITWGSSSASVFGGIIAEFDTRTALPTTPNYQAAGSVVGGTGAITVSWPTHAVGDIALLYVESTGGQPASLDTASGFVEITNSPQATGSGTAGTQLTVYWCRATSTSMADVVVGDSGNHTVGVIVTYRNCIASGNPWDTTAGDVKASASTSATAPSVSTSTDNCLVVNAITWDTDAATAQFTNGANSNLFGFANRVNEGSTQGNGGGFGIYDGVLVAHGSSGTTTATVASSINAEMTIALLPLIDNDPPTVALNSPTDTASISDTTPDLTFTGTDGDSDDITYEIQVDTADTFDSQTGSPTTVDSYSETNQSTDTTLGSGSNTGAAQSFTPSSTSDIYSAKLYLKKTGTPTGNVTVSIYAHSGTYGTSSVPTGSALATSDALDISTLTTSYVLTELLFTGSNRINLVSGTHYVLVVNYSAGSSLQIGLDNTSSTHGGNASFFFSSWNASSSLDLCFYVITADVAPLLDKVSDTDSGFTDVTNGAHTDPFPSGEQVKYTVQAGDALSDGTYYWRVRGIDPDGSNTYGDWSDTYSFDLTSGTTSSATETGVARITKTVTKTETGKSRIQKTVTQDIQGTANIRNTTNRTVTGVADIRKTASQDISGVSRIQKTVTKDITGVSNIRATATKAITGVSRLQKSVNQTITGTGRLQKTTSQTITGKANIVAASAPVSASGLTTNGSNTDASSYATASITPSADKLILAWVYSIASAAPNTPTASGNGLTWVQVATTSDNIGNRRITLFRAMGASPSSGAVTFDFGGQTQIGCAWSVVEYDNVDTSGSNGSGAIVQAVADGSGANATSFSITLSSFGSTLNATAGGFGIPLNTSGQPSVGSGFTSTGQRNQNNPNLAIASEFREDNDTSVDMSSGASSVPWAAIAVELKRSTDQKVQQTITGKANIRATATKIITGVSRITKQSTSTETGVARISAITQRTITGVADIQATSSKNETGAARIQTTGSADETGVARISTASNQTETGLARITAQAQQTETGTARITATADQTETGTARIETTVAATESGLARIATQASATETGTARVTATASATETGLARITAESSQTETGVSNITATSSQDITGVTSIFGAVNQTETGVARIEATTSSTETGTARIQETASATETGVARVSITSSATETGIARITAQESATETGLARIVATAAQTITGTGRVSNATLELITGTARIQTSSTVTETGVSRIQTTGAQTETGTARVSAQASATETGIARIQASSSQTETGTARITATASATETGVARINNQVLETITGLSRITKQAIQTITGLARITATGSQDISGKSAIASAQNKTITGVAKIIRNKKIDGALVAILETDTMAQILESTTGSAELFSNTGSQILESTTGIVTLQSPENKVIQ